MTTHKKREAVITKAKSREKKNQYTGGEANAGWIGLERLLQLCSLVLHVGIWPGYP